MRLGNRTLSKIEKTAIPSLDAKQARVMAVSHIPGENLWHLKYDFF